MSYYDNPRYGGTIFKHRPWHSAQPDTPDQGVPVYGGVKGYVSERDIRGLRVYCTLQRGVYYVTYNSAGVSASIVSGATEEEAYSKWPS